MKKILPIFALAGAALVTQTGFAAADIDFDEAFGVVEQATNYWLYGLFGGLALALAALEAMRTMASGQINWGRIMSIIFGSLILLVASYVIFDVVLPGVQDKAGNDSVTIQF